ncbi:hypothetical protein CICLE_v10017563mg, partial [Citrus x clementina]
ISVSEGAQALMHKPRALRKEATQEEQLLWVQDQWHRLLTRSTVTLPFSLLVLLLPLNLNLEHSALP